MKILYTILMACIFASCNVPDTGTTTLIDSVYITAPPISSKETYISGTIRFDTTTYAADFRGRGNSTWGKPKNPYKIKLNTKDSAFGMPAEKEFALLANYFDPTCLRNDAAFELSERMGLAWTPRRKFVDLVMNGQYVGNYLLTETVKTGKDRLAIGLIKKDTIGGFLLEADWNQGGKQNFTTATGVRFALKEPDSVNAVQLAWITGKMLTLESTINSYQSVSSLIDVDSFIKWSIVNEVFRNKDATLYGSCFFYYDGHKLFASPVWDFDLSSGGYTGSDTEGWYVNTANITGSLFKYDPVYLARYKEIWRDNFTSLQSLPDYIDMSSTRINSSALSNFELWSGGTATYDGQIVHATYHAGVDSLKSWITQRINWIDKQLK